MTKTNNVENAIRNLLNGSVDKKPVMLRLTSRAKSPKARVLSAPVPAITARTIAAAMKSAPNVVVTKSKVVAPAPKVVSPVAEKVASVPANGRKTAAYKAHKTMLERKLTDAKGNDRKWLLGKIADYDKLISAAPVVASKPKVVGSKSIPALKAHKTMLERKVIGTRGNVRKDLVAKIRSYDERISSAR